MNRSLSNREKWLGAIVGSVALVFVVILFGDWFLESRNRLQREVVSRTRQLRLLQAVAAEESYWTERDAWIRAKQPIATKDDTAGVQLLEDVKNIARKNGLVLDNQAIRPPEPHPAGVSVAVEMEIKGAWSPLVSFLYELQAPERFVALENLNLRVDAEDQTRLHGRLRIARWLGAP